MGLMGTKKKKTKEDYTQEAYMGIRHMFFVNEIIPGQKISTVIWPNG